MASGGSAQRWAEPTATCDGSGVGDHRRCRNRHSGHGFKHGLAWERERETGNSSKDLGRWDGDWTPKCGGERRIRSSELAPTSYSTRDRGEKKGRYLAHPTAELEGGSLARRE